MQLPALYGGSRRKAVTQPASESMKMKWSLSICPCGKVWIPCANMFIKAHIAESCVTANAGSRSLTVRIMRCGGFRLVISQHQKKAKGDWIICASMASPLMRSRSRICFPNQRNEQDITEG